MNSYPKSIIYKKSTVEYVLKVNHYSKVISNNNNLI